jgi:hypothetical protein
MGRGDRSSSLVMLGVCVSILVSMRMSGTQGGRDERRGLSEVESVVPAGAVGRGTRGAAFQHLRHLVTRDASGASRRIWKEAEMSTGGAHKTDSAPTDRCASGRLQDG